MTISASDILAISEDTTGQPGVPPPSRESLQWLAEAFPDHYPADEPQVVECTVSLTGGVVIDFAHRLSIYSLDVDLDTRNGILERVVPNYRALGEHDLHDPTVWVRIAQSIVHDAEWAIPPTGATSRHDPWRMLSDAIWSFHRFALNGWDDDVTLSVVEDWLTIAGTPCGENYDHLITELAERYPPAAAMVAEDARLQHALMNVKAKVRQDTMLEWMWDPAHEQASV